MMLLIFADDAADCRHSALFSWYGDDDAGCFITLAAADYAEIFTTPPAAAFTMPIPLIDAFVSPDFAHDAAPVAMSADAHCRLRIALRDTLMPLCSAADECCAMLPLPHDADDYAIS